MMLVFEYEITSNRVDCFGVIGIAREAAATFWKRISCRRLSHRPETAKMQHDYIKVTVKDNDLCPRYCARVVKNIHIAPSPKWMQRRLAVSRHPSDQQHRRYHKLCHGRVWPADACIRSTISLQAMRLLYARAEKGEKFVTLDGQERIIG